MSKLFSWRVSMSAIDRVRSLTRRSRLLVATGAALSVAGIALAADVGSAESQVQALLKARLPKTAVSAIDCGKIAGLCESTAIQPKDLCLDCGMCCGGHVFNYLALTGSDRDRLRAVGLHDAAPQNRFDFPCQFLDGACCTIYLSRPAVCAAYRCKTLAEAQDGAISLDEIGRAHV